MSSPYGFPMTQGSDLTQQGEGMIDNPYSSMSMLIDWLQQIKVMYNLCSNRLKITIKVKREKRETSEAMQLLGQQLTKVICNLRKRMPINDRFSGWGG